MTDDCTKFKVELFVGCVTWTRKKNEEEFGKAITSCLSKREHLQGSYLLCLLCSSLEFMIINIYQIKMFDYHS